MRFTWTGSFRIVLLVIAFAAICGVGYLFSKSGFSMRYANRGDIDEIQEHQIEIYKMFEAVNRQINQIHGDYQRVGHYISGHDFRHPTDFCPECGMLFELNKRKNEIDQRIINLSEEQEELKQSGLQDSKEFKDKTEEINRLTIERGLVDKHLYSSDQRAIEVNKVMRNHRLIGGTFSPNPKGN